MVSALSARSRRARIAHCLLYAVVLIVGAITSEYDRAIGGASAARSSAIPPLTCALPKTVRPGQKAEVHAIAAELRHAGYREEGQSPSAAIVCCATESRSRLALSRITAPTRPALFCARAKSIASPSRQQLSAYELEPNWSPRSLTPSNAQASTGEIRRNSENDGRCGRIDRRPPILRA